MKIRISAGSASIKRKEKKYESQMKQYTIIVLNRHFLTDSGIYVLVALTFMSVFKTDII